MPKRDPVRRPIESMRRIGRGACIVHREAQCGDCESAIVVRYGKERGKLYVWIGCEQCDTGDLYEATTDGSRAATGDAPYPKDGRARRRDPESN